MSSWLDAPAHLPSETGLFTHRQAAAAPRSPEWVRDQSSRMAREIGTGIAATSRAEGSPAQKELSQQMPWTHTLLQKNTEKGQTQVQGQGRTKTFTLSSQWGKTIVPFPATTTFSRQKRCWHLGLLRSAKDAPCNTPGRLRHLRRGPKSTISP